MTSQFGEETLEEKDKDLRDQFLKGLFDSRLQQKLYEGQTNRIFCEVLQRAQELELIQKNARDILRAFCPRLSQTNEQRRSFKLGSAGATVAGTSAPEIFNSSTATINENQPQHIGQFSDQAHVTNRDRWRSAENRYGRNSRTRYLDKTTWNQKNEDFGPGGFFPKNEPPVNRFARKPPLILRSVTPNLDLSGSYRELNRLYLNRKIRMNRVL